MKKLFGTDGIRGIAGQYPITAEMAARIGEAAAFLFRKEERRTRIVIGRDTRLSGPMLEEALVEGIASMGADALLAGVIPTPGVAFLTGKTGADAGIVISASHNPYRDNGLKVFSADGYKIGDRQEEELEELILSPDFPGPSSPAPEAGKTIPIEDAEESYLEFLRSFFPSGSDLRGFKVVLDCSHGATYRVAPRTFSRLGAEVTTLFAGPDGKNINEDCGSQHIEALTKEVLKKKADAGLAFDGDGDRLIAVDEKGSEITGDHLLAVCARMFRDEGRLNNNLVVSTVMSNIGLKIALGELGIDGAISDVGDRKVLELMLEKNAVLGGEDSGHIIFLDRHTTGDGIASALQLLAAMKFYNQPLSELTGLMVPHPQRLINVEVKETPPLEEIEELQAAVAAAEEELKDQGRVLIRYSGTQRICRVMVEGPTEEMTDRIASSLAETVRKCLA